jgi:hypothetical protein
MIPEIYARSGEPPARSWPYSVHLWNRGHLGPKGRTRKPLMLTGETGKAMMVLLGDSRAQPWLGVSSMKSRAKASGRGLFPHTSARGQTNAYGGAAGNSASNNRPGASGDGYKLGMLGDRSSPPGGGAKIMAKLEDRPEPSQRSMTGQGGCAWDKSMSPYIPGGYEPLTRAKRKE